MTTLDKRVVELEESSNKDDQHIGRAIRSNINLVKKKARRVKASESSG